MVARRWQTQEHLVDKDSLAERGRALEEDYFRKKDRELIERLRSVAADAKAREDLAAATRLNDPGVLQELHDLGFTPETISLLPLIPALQAAWAEGGVTAAERQLLMSLAHARGIAAGSPAEQQLAEWTTRRPDDALFAHANRLIRAMLDAGGLGDLTADDIVGQAEQIAAASGGVLGFGRVSAEEKTLLAQLRQALQKKP
jgi:hypothetical protein